MKVEIERCLAEDDYAPEPRVLLAEIDAELKVIGYDAANRQIRSWIFDSAGGFGTSTWSRDGNDWIIKNSQTLHDGARTSSINIITTPVIARAMGTS